MVVDICQFSVALRVLLTLNVVIVEVQVHQVSANHRNGGQLIVGQLQVQQSGYVEDLLWNSKVSQPVAVQPHKRQVSKVFKVVTEKKHTIEKKLQTQKHSIEMIQFFPRLWSYLMSDLKAQRPHQ